MDDYFNEYEPTGYDTSDSESDMYAVFHENETSKIRKNEISKNKQS